MNRRERLLATLRGDPVDRVPVSFYEINGLDQDPGDPDPFNIHSHPSWRPLLDLARRHTDLILRRGVPCRSSSPDPLESVMSMDHEQRGGSRLSVQRIRAGGGRVLTRRWRRDPDVNTVWTIEPLLKDLEDLRAFLELPAPDPVVSHVDTEGFLQAEAAVGDDGIVMVDTSDPLCYAASLFDMATYTVLALTEPVMFRRLLDRYAAVVLPATEAAARALPGRLWRICGPEYAAPPYLPPRLFRDCVCTYVRPMIESIQRYGGYARIHSHGNLRAILDDIAAMEPDGLDPVEPPPQGDVELGYVRERYGRDMVLFGNLEASDIETLRAGAFAEKVRRALEQGTAGSGRGFVLMPSACPYGRVLSETALRNYETMLEVHDTF